MSEFGVTPPTAPLRRILLATALSLLGAALILVTVVLPAEFGIDVLGTGPMLGLDGLAGQESRALEERDEMLRADAVRFELAPYESVEYKYRLARGAGIVFSWSATAAVTYDLHAQPDKAPDGFAESFARGSARAGRGTYVAEFPGIHGWFFENRTLDPVVVELSAAGFFDGAIEFRDGWESPRAIAP